MLTIVAWSLIVSLVINGGMFVIAYKFRSDKLTDASYALSFIVLALVAFLYSPKNLFAIVALALVCIWALRIGGFLLYRVIRSGRDKRFDGIRENFWQFGKFWLGQAVTVWVLMFPATMGLLSGASFNAIMLVGVGIWCAGFIIETLADVQKYRFTSDVAHKGQWIDSGVWRYSRHPNYFGEIMIWIGVYFYNFFALSPSARLVGALSPIVITILLLFVSGIPILEKEADRRWGSQRAYQDYKKHTSLLIPLPKRKG